MRVADAPSDGGSGQQETRRRRWSGLRGELCRVILAGIAALVAGVAIGHRSGHPSDRMADIVASINGSPITGAALFHRLEVAGGQGVLSRMIDEEMTLQYARKLGVFPPDREVDAKLAEARTGLNYAANLAATHQTEADARRNILINLARSAILVAGVTVTEADARAFYATNCDPRNRRARYFTPETVQIAVIVTRHQADAAKARARLAGGEDFSKVAQAVSEDASARVGGLLPPVQRGRARFDRLPGLEDRLFRMKPGEVIGPVEIGKGWWIIRCLRHAPEVRVPFDRVREECREGARITRGLQLNSRKIAADLGTFRKVAKITVYWKEYRALEEKN